jgi:hypothetical protein
MLVAMVVVPAGMAAADGILIEAETPARRDSKAGAFATETRDPSAFGGAAVSRFFEPGACEYAVRIPEDGEYGIWLRYASNRDQVIGYAIAAAGSPRPPKTETATLAGTGALSGPGAWTWARLGTKSLKAGDHVLRLHNAPIRPDCLWLGRSGEPPASPVDANAGRMVETRQHLANPLEPIAPDWLAAADAYRLPDWYDSIRVCAHTRLSWPWRERGPDAFEHAGAKLASVGFREIARHMRSGGEPAWWPSAVGAVQPEARARNFAKEAIDEAHAAGCRIILYHRHMEDDAYAREHPGQRAIDAQGRAVVKRGAKVCLNTPFADFVQTRLVELAKMGADGFYFDEVHMEKPFCWCPACKAGLRKETGLDYPASADPYDPAYQKAVEYKNVVMERLFRRWREAIHRINPQCVLLIGSNTYPAMNDRHFTHRLCRISDAMKTEFNLAARAGNNRIFADAGPLAPPETDARIALGYAIARDACDGRPPHVWAHGLPDPVQARFAAAGMIAHGMVANLDVREAGLPEKDLFADAVALGNRVSPAFAGLRPLRWGLVHFSETARDFHLPDEAAAWREVLYPTYGAFTALLRAHLPVGILTDSQLEQGRLDGCGLLFLPSTGRLTPAMRAAVDAFRSRGGCVVEQRPDWAWHEPGAFGRVSGAFLGEAARSRTRAPVEARGGPEKMHMVAFSGTDGRLTVALVNDFSWVQTGSKPAPAGMKTAAAATRAPSAEGEDEPVIGGGAGGVPEPCRGVRVTLRLPARPGTVADRVTGRVLPVGGGDGAWTVDVPEFDCMAVLEVAAAP